MHKRLAVLCVLALFFLAASVANAKSGSKPQGSQAIVIVFKDGHQQSFSMADVSRIEFKGAAATDATASEDVPSTLPLGRGHFLGKWELGEGNGDNFYVTLDASGEATKSIGDVRHGKWTVVNGEARISWDDGSHDAIRKVGAKYEKFWYPDGNFSGKPNNVTNAVHVEARPI
jgi:hypothetical protein